MRLKGRQVKQKVNIAKRAKEKSILGKINQHYGKLNFHLRPISRFSRMQEREMGGGGNGIDILCKNNPYHTQSDNVKYVQRKQNT